LFPERYVVKHHWVFQDQEVPILKTWPPSFSCGGVLEKENTNSVAPTVLQPKELKGESYPSLPKKRVKPLRGRNY